MDWLLIVIIVSALLAYAWIKRKGKRDTIIEITITEDDEPVGKHEAGRGKHEAR